MCLGGVPTCMPVHRMHAWSLGRPASVSNALELELEMLGSHHLECEELNLGLLEKKPEFS